MSSYHHDGRQTSKARAKVVKPILRRFTQSEKNSLDLDRPATEQSDGLGIYDFGATRSAHDVSFVHTSRRGYHNRNTSGNSQFSTATSGSGHRNGSFVHPFQQTPRPYTPPLGVANSYQNSLRESEHSIRSPAFAEDEEQDNLHSHSHLYHPSSFANPNSTSNRTPSLTGSTTTNNIHSPPLRIQTKHTPSSSRLARGSHTSLSSTLILSSPDFASPTDTMSPMSTLRTSFDRTTRKRSQSNGVTQTVEEARREFYEKQELKEEKIAQEEIRKMQKEARKEAKGRTGAHRRSSASDATRSKRSKSDLTSAQYEKGVFGHEYDTTAIEEPPYMGEENPDMPKPTRTSSSARNLKKKSNSGFHTILMWIRTRILRMKRKTSTY